MQLPGDPGEDARTRRASTAVQQLEARFKTAWTTADNAAGTDPLLLPDRLASACVSVLPIDGAGLSLIEDRFRVPLGASDAEASFAEQLQFTQGEGPCLDAAGDRSVVAVGAGDIERRWPQFADELLSHTSYRAVISIPLALHHHATGALDLFLTDETHLGRVRLAEAAGIAAVVVETLQSPGVATMSAEWSISDVPVWLLSSRVQTRQLVWVAVGMVMGRFHTEAPHALAALRAHAYGNDSTVDDVAAGLVNGSLHLTELTP